MLKPTSASNDSQEMPSEIKEEGDQSKWKRQIGAFVQIGTVFKDDNKKNLVVV
jgi:hypothetical protein